MKTNTFKIILEKIEHSASVSYCNLEDFEQRENGANDGGEPATTGITIMATINTFQ